MASIDATPMSRLDLTPWDLQMLLLEPIQYGILFHKPKFPINFIIEYLKASLSRVLDYFPPLAGRLSTEKSNNNNKTAVYFVDCNNKGAGFIHAAATDVSVAYISEAKHTPEIVFSFFPLNGTRNFQGTSEPLFAVQITELEDGLFVGCAANHAVMDGSSLWHLIRSWSEIVRGREKISKMPSFARDFPGWENRSIPVRVIDFDAKIVRPPLVERSFHISKESVAKLKARANSEGEEFTSFQVIVAHIWRCVARSRKKTGGNREEVFVTSVGARGKIPLPEGYFGNAFDVARLHMSEGELLGDGLGRAALGLKALFAGKGKEEVVLGFLEEWVKEPRLHVHVEGSFTFAVTSFPMFDAYGGMGNVGLGKPVAVRSGKAQKWDGRVMLFTAAEGDGVDVEVCLVPEVMAALEEDADLIPMASIDPTPMSRLDLTPWDLQMLLLEPIQYGILFHKPAFPINFIIEYLKASLSRVLDYFPPLAGRLSTEISNNTKTAVYFVDCNNKGASFIHAAATNVSVAHILEATYTPEIVFSFFPLNGTHNFQGTSEPLFAIQITELEDGLFMGCAANHAVMDGSSLWHLICSWSEIARGREKISEMPSFVRDFPGWENRQVPVRVLDFDAKIVRQPLVERAFHISKESVAKLKARANSKADEFTSFQVIVAHLWRCVARSRKKTGRKREEVFVTSVGARGKISLPEGYFGNAIEVTKLCMGEGELLGDGLGRVALGLKEFFARKGTGKDVLCFLEEWAKEPRLPVYVEGSFTLGVTSFPKFDAYGDMGNIGLGKPVAVRTGKAVKWDGRVMLFTAAEGDGVDVELCLAPEVMAALEEDDEFMELIKSQCLNKRFTSDNGSFDTFRAVEGGVKCTRALAKT
ncbi:HXXXD-type acyl-transferase family protein [Striga asiatica]|uniref:HXXXD-type acyl-transferase family protein n=1 Tax=Striga asiatica TaxID=4170 RepID=A0A5A7QXZ4_STRAF|nr:HXXXD-type acyl-transferase family protein [Striga asiatica]